MMVDPFQPLVNASGSCGTYKNSEILMFRLNMSEHNSISDKLNKLHAIPNTTDDENAATTITSTAINANETTLLNAVKVASDIQQHDSDRLPDDEECAIVEHNIMGCPSNSESDSLIVSSNRNRSACDNYTDGSVANIVESTVQTTINSSSAEKEWNEPDSSTNNQNNSPVSEQRPPPLTPKPLLINTNDNHRLINILKSGTNSSSSSAAVILNTTSLPQSKSSNNNSNSNENQINYSEQNLSQVESLRKMEEEKRTKDSADNEISTASTTEIPSVPLTTVGLSIDNRKVEPLKINLHRDPIILKIPKPPDSSIEPVPKITIKPIQKPTEFTEAVPKLTIVVDSTSSSSVVNNISTLDAPQEPHIVPKLTIRNSTNITGAGSQSVIVPKLTIKMDNHITSQTINKDKSHILDDGVKLTIKPMPELPIPKLTIKTTSDEKAEILNNTAASATSITKYSVNTGSSSPQTRATNFKPNVKSTENIVPKLKIKQIIGSSADEQTEQGPQFTVSRFDENNVMSQQNCSETTTKLVPKLLVRVPKDQDHVAASAISIDTFTTKEQKYNDVVDEIEATTATTPASVAIVKNMNKKHDPPDLESIPKLTIRQVKDPDQLPEETIVIPKVTIKPIINPNNEKDDSETLVTPKITLKPIPKPIDITQPLEVVTSCSSFKSKLESTDSQHSPRIIIKINKNVSETITKNELEKEIELTEQIASQDGQISSSQSVSLEKILKRPPSSQLTALEPQIEAKKQKIDDNTNSWPNTSHITVDTTGSHKIDYNVLIKEKLLSFSNQTIDKEIKLKEVRSLHRMRIQNDMKLCEEKPEQILVCKSVPENAAHNDDANMSLETNIKIENSNTKQIDKIPTLFPLFSNEKLRHPDSDVPGVSDKQQLLLENNNLNMNRNSQSAVLNQTSKQHSKSSTKCTSEVIVLSEGSSSDCIMVEDNNLVTLSMTSFNLEQINKNGNSVSKDLNISTADVRLERSRTDGIPNKRGRGRGRPKRSGIPLSSTCGGSEKNSRNFNSNMPPFNSDVSNTDIIPNDQSCIQHMFATATNSPNITEEKLNAEIKMTRSSMSKFLIAKSQTDEEQKYKDPPPLKIHRTRGCNETLRHDSVVIGTGVVDITAKQMLAPAPNVTQLDNTIGGNCKIEFNSPLFPIRREENATAMIHPLLVQNIERAKLLEALMNTKKEVQINIDNSLSNNLPRCSQALDMSEDSSSDCILVEDNGSRNISSIDFNIKKDNESKTSVDIEGIIDRDSGVEVSNSMKSLIDVTEVDIIPPPIQKRGRGRPKKNIMLNQLDRKQIDLDIVKRKFAGVLMSEHNAKANEILNSVPNRENTKDENPESKSEVKERKRRIRIDDDDESPTFNPISRNVRRGRGRGGRGSRGRGKYRIQSKYSGIGILSTPEKAKDIGAFSNVDGKDRKKCKETATLQLFEEDTRMSADLLSTPIRGTEFLQHNEESQSSLLSTASATVESSITKKRSKIEVADPEGKTEFTVDMIAEYDWPPPKGCCPARNRDTFMIQEQIAEYLGVKSFKRKYQDLPRRTVEMEERNYLMERGLVSEKMCDLGLTAVLASDVLDIMHNDFFEKYEEYKKFLRVKYIKDLAAKQKAIQNEAVEKNLSARDHAIQSVASWNLNFNKSRNDDRRHCLDLQTLVIHLPEESRKKMSRPTSTVSNYPIAVVPGQFQEYYRQYNAAELLCYPINTALADPVDLDKKLRDYSKNKTDCDSDDSSSDSDSDAESSDEDTSDSSDEDQTSDNTKCHVCDKPQYSNQDDKPEVFVSCSTCRRKSHPSCIEMPHRMSLRIREYAWQCTECKYCYKCQQKINEDKMLYCDQCDRAYHIYCIGLQVIPTGRWHCSICSICTKCGSRRPEGQRKPNLTNQQYKRLLSTSKWTHEYRINHVSNLREHSATLCVPCARVNSGKHT